MAAILKSKMVVSGNDIVRFYFMTICFRQFPCSLCYIELSSLYLKVAKRHENNINFNISVKKISRPSNLHTAHRSRYTMRWYSQTKYFPSGSIFFPIYKLLKKGCIYKFVNSKKRLPVGKYFFANTIA